MPALHIQSTAWEARLTMSEDDPEIPSLLGFRASEIERVCINGAVHPRAVGCVERVATLGPKPSKEKK